MTAEATRLWAELTPDASGLVTAVVQHATDGRVLMVGHMNEAAVAATLGSRRVTFFSRSRQELWEKGETSGHTLDLVALRVDCDGDALLATAQPRGPTCHTGRPSCFFRPVGAPSDEGPGEVSALARLQAVIAQRQAGEGMTNADGDSYVRRLLAGGPAKIAAKVREEAAELCAALEEETDDRVASEAADLVFHMLVGLAARGIRLEDVSTVLDARHGTSGVDEKASR